MTTTTTSPRCPLGISGKTLSSWRNDGLSRGEAERIAAHASECPACQERLAEFDEIRRALRGQTEPDGHDRLWRDVRMSIPQTGGAAHARRPLTMRALLPRLATVAAVLALIVAFVAVFGNRLNQQRGISRQTQPEQTPIVMQSGSLTWRQVIFPPGISPDQPHTELRVVEDAATSAYLCGASNPGDPVSVWVTHDRGAHWSEIKRIKANFHTTGCGIGADANDPNIVVINVYEVASDGSAAHEDQWQSYASMDGGKSWIKPDALQGMDVVNLASFHEHTYAIGSTGKEFHLYISDDQMRDWSTIDADIFSTLRTEGANGQIDVARVWVNDVSGDLLVETDFNYRLTGLWLSHDRGYTWTQIPPPATEVNNSASPTNATPQTPTSSSTFEGLVLVQPNSATAAWRICSAVARDNGQTSGNSVFECTTSDGQQWTQVSDSPRDVAAMPIAIAPDGSLLAIGLGPSNSSRAIGGSTSGHSLLRLPTGTTSADAWTKLGDVPGPPSGSGLAVYANGDAVVAWTFNGPGPAGNQSYTAVYP